MREPTDHTIKADDNPLCKSEIYMGVMIRCDSINGWSCPDFGMGSARFVHDNHDDLHINGDKEGDSDDWTENVWYGLIDHIKKNMQQ